MRGVKTRATVVGSSFHQGRNDQTALGVCTCERGGHMGKHFPTGTPCDDGANGPGEPPGSGGGVSWGGRGDEEWAESWRPVEGNTD